MQVDDQLKKALPVLTNLLRGHLLSGKRNLVIIETAHSKMVIKTVPRDVVWETPK